MAALLLLVAIIGGVVVGDLVMENTAAGTVTVAHHPITGFSQGMLLAMAAALGLLVGLLLVASASTTRTRRTRRRQLRTLERDLPRQLAELEGENAQLREELARDQRVRQLGDFAGPAGYDAPWTGPAADHPEPLYEEARRAARLRSQQARRP